MSHHSFDVERLLAEADAKDFAGWDFSWLDGRVRIEAPAWDYTTMVERLARQSEDLLDLGTGGGEWLADLPLRPARTVATEAWPPNVTVTANRLRGVGVPVVQVERAPDNGDQLGDDRRGRLPFRDAAFSLVVNRHEAFVAHEVARILAPGGCFFTQQVDLHSFDDCFRLLGLSPPPMPVESWLSFAIKQVGNAGLTIVSSGRGVEMHRFCDVGAFAWYLKVLPGSDWGLDDFTIDAYREQLHRVHRQILRDGQVTVRQTRLFLEARKPANRI